MAIIDVRERPALRRPVLLAGFGGWGDAGGGATGAISYLLGDDEPAPIATFDPEQCYDLTVQRPVTMKDDHDRWTLVYPEIRISAVRRPQASRDLLLMSGPEPHMNWRAITRATAQFARELGVGELMTMGVFLGSVSHRSVSLVRRVLDPVLDAKLEEIGAIDTGYQGPTGFVTALVHGFGEAGIPSASIWSAAPIYLRAVNPAVALGLLEGVEKVLDLDLDLDSLRSRSIAFIREVDEMLASNPELANQLSNLIDLGPSPDDRQPDLPSGASLIESLEEYLKQQRSE